LHRVTRDSSAGAACAGPTAERRSAGHTREDLRSTTSQRDSGKDDGHRRREDGRSAALERRQIRPGAYHAAGAEAAAFTQADRLAGGGSSVRFGVPLQFAKERGGVDAELFGSVELVPAVALQDGEDVFAFDVVEGAHRWRGADE
jgi:hypothetical protein